MKVQVGSGASFMVALMGERVRPKLRRVGRLFVVAQARKLGLRSPGWSWVGRGRVGYSSVGWRVVGGRSGRWVLARPLLVLAWRP